MIKKIVVVSVLILALVYFNVKDINDEVVYMDETTTLKKAVEYDPVITQKFEVLEDNSRYFNALGEYGDYVANEPYDKGMYVIEFKNDDAIKILAANR